MDPAARFKFLLDRLQDMAGGERPGFCQTTYLSEYETAWRNNALMYHMEEHDVFPSDVNPQEVLDTYIQCCAIEVNARRAAAMAATLAAGGRCPVTDEQCLLPATVKSALTLMLSCGMYDFSGQWTVYVGLPAKSGVAGLVYCVIPNVAGIAVWSPPLDSHGNSVRAVELFRRLLRRYNYSMFDKLVADGLTRLPSCLSAHDLLLLGQMGQRRLEKQAGKGVGGAAPSLPGHTEATPTKTHLPAAGAGAVASPPAQLQLPGGTSIRNQAMGNVDDVEETLLEDSDEDDDGRPTEDLEDIRLTGFKLHHNRDPPSTSLAGSTPAGSAASSSSPDQRGAQDKARAVARRANILLPMRNMTRNVAVWKLLSSWVSSPESLGIAARCMAAMAARGSPVSLPARPGDTAQPLVKLLAFLASQGIVADPAQNEMAAAAIMNLPRINETRVSLRSLVGDPRSTTGAYGALILRAMRNQLVVPNFHLFAAQLSRMALAADSMLELGLDTQDNASVASGISHEAGHPGPGGGDGHDAAATLSDAAKARMNTIYQRKLNQRDDSKKAYTALQVALEKAYLELELAPGAGAAVGAADRRPGSASSSVTGGRDGRDPVPSGSTPAHSRTPVTPKVSIDHLPGSQSDQPRRSGVSGVQGGRAVGLAAAANLAQEQGDADSENFLRMTLTSLGVTRHSMDVRAATGAQRERSGGLLASAEVIRDLLRESDTQFDRHFAVSICTVDGQQFTCGSSAMACQYRVPLMETVKPMLYAMALQDVGLAELHKYVSAEPTASDPNSFTLLTPSGHGEGQGPAPRPMPHNPFTLAGALCVASLLGKGHMGRGERLFADGGGRFELVRNRLTQWAGGNKAGFNNPTFLALKRSARQTMAVSHYMKGQGTFPARADPTDVAHFYAQCMSVEMSTQEVANVAGMMANIGVTPTTWKPCLHPTVSKQLLSLLYSCGMNAFGGKWNFNVGIPASTGSTGMMMAVIPGVAGMAIFSPRINPYNVPLKGLRLCEMLVKRFHMNLFDSMVNTKQFSEDEGAAAGPQAAHAQPHVNVHATVTAFELCTAVAAADTKKVSHLLVQGVDINHKDYDARTALHVAACEGLLGIAQELVYAGADPSVPDRWGNTPLDEARRRGFTAMAATFEMELLARGQDIPGDEPVAGDWTGGVAAGVYDMPGLAASLGKSSRLQKIAPGVKVQHSPSDPAGVPMFSPRPPLEAASTATTPTRPPRIRAQRTTPRHE